MAVFTGSHRAYFHDVCCTTLIEFNGSSLSSLSKACFIWLCYQSYCVSTHVLILSVLSTLTSNLFVSAVLVWEGVGHFPPDNSPPICYAYIHTHVCMHTHTHTYIHTYIHIHTYIYIHTYTYIHIHAYIYTHTYTYIHIQAYIHIHLYVCMRVYYVCMYVYIYV